MGEKTSDVRGQRPDVRSVAAPGERTQLNVVGELPAWKLSEVTVVGVGEGSANVG
jgi:hypothetical protein